MATFDYGLNLMQQQEWQQAVRIFHRCVVLRSDVGGAWQYLGDVLQELEENQAAEAARRRGAALATPG